MVDERMWGDEDKPEPDQKPGEEQRGKDAPAQVACLSPNPGTYRTVQRHKPPQYNMHGLRRANKTSA